MDLKQMVGIESAKYVKDGMTVGLGTGSTAYFMVEEIGRRIKEEGLTITGVTTSKATEKQALGLGIPLKSIDEVDYVDITIDGAD
jgi:ribose 5-phosphate isomerase A